MRQRHTGDVSNFIESIFDFTSDIYSLPRTFSVYLVQYEIHLGQYGIQLGRYGIHIG